MNKKRLSKLIQKDFEKLYNEKEKIHKRSNIDLSEFQGEINSIILPSEIEIEKQNLRTIKNELKKYIHLPKNKKIKYNGRLRKYWSVINIILNKSKHVNNLISEYENYLKIERRRPFKVSKKEINLKEVEFAQYYFIWDRKKAEEDILNDVSIDYFNGISVKKDMDLIIDYLNEVFTLMQSRDIFVLVVNLVTFKSYSYVVTDNEDKFDELYFSQKV